MKKSICILLFLFILPCISQNTFAQTAYTPYVYSTPVYQRIYDQTYTTNMAINGMMRSEILRADMNALNKRKANRMPQPTSGPTQFKPSGRNFLTDAEILQMAGGDKKAAVELEKFGTEALMDYHRRALRYRLPSFDIATSVGYAIIKYHQVAHNYIRSKDSIQINDFSQIVKQIREAMITDGKITKLSPFEKERMLGMNILVAEKLNKMYETAIGNDDQKAIADSGQVARKMLEDIVGAPFDKIVISSDGISIKK